MGAGVMAAAWVMVVVIVTAAATLMVAVTVTAAAWALALRWDFRLSGRDIIRTPPTLILPILISDLITPIRGKRRHLLVDTLSKATLRQPQHQHPPRSKTGTSAPVPMPITPM